MSHSVITYTRTHTHIYVYKIHFYKRHLEHWTLAESITLLQSSSRSKHASIQLETCPSASRSPFCLCNVCTTRLNQPSKRTGFPWKMQTDPGARQSSSSIVSAYFLYQCHSRLPFSVSLYQHNRKGNSENAYQLAVISSWTLPYSGASNSISCP